MHVLYLDHFAEWIGARHLTFWAIGGIALGDMELRASSKRKRSKAPFLLIKISVINNLRKNDKQVDLDVRLGNI